MKIFKLRYFLGSMFATIFVHDPSSALACIDSNANAAFVPNAVMDSIKTFWGRTICNGIITNNERKIRG